MEICLCAALLYWTHWNCCPLNTCCSPVTHIHTRSFYFSPVIAVPLTVSMSALPPVIQCKVTFKTCQLLVFQCVVGEVDVCCSFVPIPAVQFMLTAVNILNMDALPLPSHVTLFKSHY